MTRSNTPALGAIALATFLTLVPITLLVPGLTELVVDRHGGTRFQAHLFVSLNQLAGIVAVPVAMALHRRWPQTRRWVMGLLALDAVSFVGMGASTTLAGLFAWRALDGIAHLPAVTFLMIAANRSGGERRGASLGLVAGALMVGVGVGAPLGGLLIDRDPLSVYRVGAVLLLLASVTGAFVPESAAPARDPQARYRWDRRRLVSWMPLAYGFADRFLIGIFVSTFTLFLTEVHGVGAATRGMLMSLFLLPFAVLSWPAGKLADRVGWFWPLIGANVAFGGVYALYGFLPMSLLPWAMIASGVLSALMFAPSLVLVSDFAKRGAGEGLFGSFQVAGSFGFLTGPLVGGTLVEVLRRADGAPAWSTIFTGVGLLLSAFGLFSWRVLGPIARSDRLPDPPGRRGGVVNVPVLAPSVDSRGNAFTRTVATGLMRIFGWRFTGEPIPDVKKMVLIVAPHTSNWDFCVGVMAKYAIGLRGTFLGKDTLFRFPLGLLMRWLGGIPVDRFSKQDVVTQTAELVQQRERVTIALSPEGTRKATPRWRSGFWWIAHKAQIPIVPVAFDFSTRSIHIHPPFATTGDPDRDIQTLRALYTPQMAFDPRKYIP
ncbi:MAG: MFS transporter [Gemmatimonadaceae bacterium]|nr:MFS transporter [Gemmatimonadaceae bacterium]MCW5826610.1 MFS transporter [Gemmatimonadaceae bacterium]